MNKILLASALLLAIVSIAECRKYQCAEYTDADADTLFDKEKGKAKAEWKQLNKKRGKSFASEQAEEAHRRNLYRKVAKLITKENRKNGGKTCMRLNDFAMMDEDERKDYSGTLPIELPPMDAAIDELGATSGKHRVSKRSVPTSLFHPTGDVGHQRGCGSCSLWSSVHVLNGYLIKAHSKTIELSEKQLLDCFYRHEGVKYNCTSLTIFNPYDYFKTHLPVEKHTYAPYDATAEECGTQTSGQFVQDYAKYFHHTTDDQIMEMLQNGPVGAAMDVNYYFHFHDQGILERSNGTLCTGGGHAITIVGYGSEDGADYFVAKNSWGYHWGEKGYFRIRRLGGGTTAYGRYCDWGLNMAQPQLSGAVPHAYDDEHAVPDTYQTLPLFAGGPDPTICCVTVYEHVDYAGKSQRFCGKDNEVGADWAEAIGSLRVEAHCLAWIYADTGAWGFMREIARANDHIDSAVHAIEVAYVE